MRFVGRHGEEIRSLDDWARLGKPAAEHHWVPGRSAYELAADWLCGDAREHVAALLSLRPEFAGLELDVGIAEQKTRFDDIPRGPRNHDLLVQARTSAGGIVIGVEGKADEPFDLPLKAWQERAVRRNPNSQAPARLDNLT